MGSTINQQINIYQFIDSSKVIDKDYINTILDYNAIICFDLEDSIKSDNKNYQLTRTKIFSDISELISNNINIVEIGIRINSYKSGFYLEDIIRISQILNEYCHVNFFLPKVSTSSELTKTVKAIHSNKIQNFEIIPIIESKNGMNKLTEILFNESICISKIAFGHCDYNLDCNHFPFHHQDSDKYWSWINDISQICGEEITFLNSPYLNLKDDDYLFEILSKVKKVTKKSGQITLTLRQSKVCNLFNKQNYRPPKNPELISKIENVNKFAMDLINNFEQYKVEGKNFAIIPNQKKLISPQEYAKAKEVIGVNNEIKN